MTPRNDWKFHKRYRICSTQNTILSFFRVFSGKICILSDFRAVVPGQSLYFVGCPWQRCVLMAEWDGRRAEFMAFTSSLAIFLSCLLVVSLALQILIHFSWVSLLSANNLFLVLFSRIPRTTRSCSVPKLHVLIKERKAVRYEPNDSPCCWSRLLKTLKTVHKFHSFHRYSTLPASLKLYLCPVGRPLCHTIIHQKCPKHRTQYMREVSLREDLSPACLGASQSHSSSRCA